MVEQCIWLRHIFRRRQEFLTGPRVRRGWSVIFLLAATTAIIMLPWSGMAGERFIGENHTGIQRTSAEKAKLPQQPTNQEAHGTAEAPAAEGALPTSIAELQILLTSDERRELAKNLGALVREGNTTGAKQLLSAAIETGTLAIILSDYIEDPALHTWLKTLASEGLDRPSVASPRASDNGAVHTGEVRSTDIDEALERERNRADAMSHQLSALREQVLTLNAHETRAAELENALAQEKERAALITRELEAAHRQLADARRDEAVIAQVRDEAERERGRADAALSELAAAQEQLAALKASAMEAAELKISLAQEKEHSRLIARELDALKEQLASLEASGTRAAEIQDAAARERQRADLALQQVTTLQDQLSALKADEAKTQDALKRERERNAFAARQLTGALAEAASLRANASDLREVKDALSREKAKTAAALRELDTVKEQLAALKNGTEFMPAALLFQTPPILPEPPAHGFPDGAEQDDKANRAGEEPQHKARQGALSPDAQAPGKSSDEATRTQNPSKKSPVRPAEARVSKPSPEARNPSAAPKRNGSKRGSRPPPVLAWETFDPPDNPAPGLPTVLLPDDSLWRFY